MLLSGVGISEPGAKSSMVTATALNVGLFTSGAEYVIVPVGLHVHIGYWGNSGENVTERSERMSLEDTAHLCMQKSYLDNKDAIVMLTLNY